MGEWKESTLGDVSIDGGHYGIAASAVPLDASLPTYLRITDIRDDGTINKSGLTSVDDPNSVEYILSPNDLVIARTGASTGRNYFYDGRDGELVYAGFLIKFSIDPNKIYPQYVKYWFLSPFYKAWLNSHTDGSTRANINAVTLADCPIRFPADLPTQRRIAAALGALDDKIEVNRKICENLEAQAQALFRAWFVDFEPFGGKRPEGWKMGKLGDVVEFKNGFAFKSSEFKERARYKVITIKAVQNGNLVTEGADCIDDIPTKMPSWCVLRDADILLSLTGNVARCCLVYEDDLLLNQRVARLVPRTAEDIAFVYALFRSDKTRKRLETIAKGTAQANLSPIETADLPQLIPAEAERSRFANLCNPMIEAIVKTNRESRALAAMRDALLPKLMSGELAVEKVALF